MDIDMGTSRLRSPTPIHGSGVTGDRPVTELKIRFSVNGGLCSSVRGGGALRTKQVPVNCSASKTTSCRFSRLPGQLPFMWMSGSTKQPQLLLPRWCLSTVGVQFPTRTTSVLCTRSD